MSASVGLSAHICATYYGEPTNEVNTDTSPYGLILSITASSKMTWPRNGGESLGTDTLKTLPQCVSGC